MMNRRGFYIKRTELEEKECQRYVFERIANLPLKQQTHISDKYYKSKMPWHLPKWQ